MLNLTYRRLELLSHLGSVALNPDGTITRVNRGRTWSVKAEIEKLLAAGLIEPDPETDDLDVKGYRPTQTGRIAYGLMVPGTDLKHAI